MDNLTLSAIIKNNIGLKNLEAYCGDKVIYDNESGTRVISGIALDIGATYEMFITSAVDGITGNQYGQQKVTIKLIPAEDTPKNYDLYMPVHYFDLDSNDISAVFTHIYKYDTELWIIENSNPIQDIKIYKIVKKAV